MSEPPTDPPLVLRPAQESDAPLVIRRPPRPGFWEAIIWCLIFLAGQVLGAVVGASVVFVFYSLDQPEPGKFLEAQLGAFVKATGPKVEGETAAVPFEFGNALAWGVLTAQFVSLGLIALVLPRRIGPDWKRQIAVRRPAGVHLLLVLLIVPGFLMGADAIQTAFSWLTGVPPSSMSGVIKGMFGPFPWPLTALAVAVGPGVVEELWCRGFIGRGLSARYGLPAGVLLTSLLFALMHGDPVQVVVYTVMGAYLHGVYLATRSIWPPVLLHACNNGLAVLLELNVPAEQLAAVPVWQAYLCAGAILLFGSLALWTCRAKPEGTSGEEGWKPEYPGISAPPAESSVRLSHAAPRPVALGITIISFGAMMWLAYTYLS